VSYAPATASGSTAQTATLNLGLGNVATGTPGSVTLTGNSASMAAGAVSPTANPQVAAYTITPPFDATVSVNFGPDTKYGLKTSTVSAPAGGGTVTIYVAGMRASSTYHMQAAVNFSNGIKITDKDQTFKTGAVPAGFPTNITATTASGMTPQPGVELFDTLSQVFATDLQGNIIWTYLFSDRLPGSTPYPAKMMPNGHIIMGIAPVSQTVLTSPATNQTQDVIREIDLAGNTVKELTMAQLNAALAANGFVENNTKSNPKPTMKLAVFSHDLTVLPNNHLLLLIADERPCSDVPGCTGAPNILGDVVVDVDENFNPVWAWNEFDTLDVTRQPEKGALGFPDWTHSNALTYSPDDGNFLVSIRHQNWVVKVNYQDGKGDASIMWRLGYQGDFALKGGTDPYDWFYDQHYPTFVSSNTSGSFQLTLMDNGDARPVRPGCDNATTAPNTTPPCQYTSTPILTIDETAKTATIDFQHRLPNSLYSSFAGNTEILANGNMEYAINPGAAGGASVYEITKDSNQSAVWQEQFPGQFIYRIVRLPSLYPDVQW
jgi:arylsulfate sulfotransferase